MNFSIYYSGLPSGAIKGQRAVGCVLARTIAVSAPAAASPKARRVQARARPVTGNPAEAI